MRCATNRSLPIVAVGIALVVAAEGCSRSERSDGHGAASGAPNSWVRADDGSEARVRLGPGPIPAEFPPNVPLYPGAQLTSTVRTAKDVVVLLSTRDPVGAVLEFYRKQPGYEEISDQTIGDQRVLHFKHAASTKDFQVVVKVGDGLTQVSLVAPVG